MVKADGADFLRVDAISVGSFADKHDGALDVLQHGGVVPAVPADAVL